MFVSLGAVSFSNRPGYDSIVHLNCLLPFLLALKISIDSIVDVNGFWLVVRTFNALQVCIDYTRVTVLFLFLAIVVT